MNLNLDRMNNWQNLSFLAGGILFIVFVCFGIYLFYKVYTIKDVVYCVYDDRDIYENLAIGSHDECHEWIDDMYPLQTDNLQFDDSENVEMRAHLHITLYFDWKFKRKNK